MLITNSESHFKLTEIYKQTGLLKPVKAEDQN